VRTGLSALVIVGVAILHGGSAEGQAEQVAGARLKFGPVAGVSRGRLSPTTGSDREFDARLGVVGGGILLAPVSTNLSIQSGLLLSEKGASRDQEYGDSYRLVYVEVPALLRVHWNATSARPYALGGASGAVLVWSKPTYLRDWNVGKRRFDVGLVVGAGVEVVRSSPALFFEASYTHGLVDLVTCDCANVRTAEHRAVTVTMGLLF